MTSLERMNLTTETCVFCQGKEYKTKSYCAWLKVQAHCRCCQVFFGISLMPCGEIKESQS